MPVPVTSARGSSARRLFSNSTFQPATSPLLDRETFELLLRRVQVAQLLGMFDLAVAISPPLALLNRVDRHRADELIGTFYPHRQVKAVGGVL
jgi:hypothetical protein